MNLLDYMMKDIDAIVNAPHGQWQGWHNERVVPDRAAFQQDRREFYSLLDYIIDALQGFRNSCLQLGMGPSGISHEVWRRVFAHATTIDLAVLAHDGAYHRPGQDTHSHAAMEWAAGQQPFDFLFIDAGHTLQDVAADYYTYSQFVRSGGVIAFHDALDRPGYPEVKVHEFIKNFPVTVFGTEVGTAVMMKP